MKMKKPIIRFDNGQEIRPSPDPQADVLVPLGPRPAVLVSRDEVTAELGRSGNPAEPKFVRKVAHLLKHGRRSKRKPSTPVPEEGSWIWIPSEYYRRGSKHVYGGRAKVVRKYSDTLEGESRTMIVVAIRSGSAYEWSYLAPLQSRLKAAYGRKHARMDSKA